MVTSVFPTIRAVMAEARLNVSPRIWDFIEGGASGEDGLALNRSAFSTWNFDPVMFAGLRRPSLETELLGIPMSMPVFVSPFGFDRAIHPAGYAAVAQAVGQMGITSIVSESSSDSLSELAPNFDGRQGMVQVGLVGSEEHVLGFDERAAQAGYRALCLTDLPTKAWRERMRLTRSASPVMSRDLDGIGSGSNP
jgi:isopentenyl diphosphate isomerase/L-lactate dehydrogenase-like FMN-dependent dehydrogenase